jgi:energy-coupling factor transporter transmembrane protein EcfT
MKTRTFWYIIGFLFITTSVFVALLAALVIFILSFMFATWTVPHINLFVNPITYAYIRSALVIAIACGTAYAFSKENRKLVIKHSERHKG